jgi:hypothetical protein
MVGMDVVRVYVIFKGSLGRVMMMMMMMMVLVAVDVK